MPMPWPSRRSLSIANYRRHGLHGAETKPRRGFAATEVQISETETPLHRLETVYRRLMENLSTRETDQGAFRNIIDGWFYTLEEDVLAEGFDPKDAAKLLARSDELMEQRLAGIGVGHDADLCHRLVNVGEAFGPVDEPDNTDTGR